MAITTENLQIHYGFSPACHLKEIIPFTQYNETQLCLNNKYQSTGRYMGGQRFT